MNGTTNNYDRLWPAAKAEQAKAEGWEVGLVVNSGQPLTRAFFDIFDISSDQTFKNRSAALIHVFAKAKGGSRLHQDALTAVKATSIFRGRS